MDDEHGTADASDVLSEWAFAQAENPPAPIGRSQANLATEFTHVYFNEARKVVGFLMTIGATQHEAADAAQQAFELAWRKWWDIRNPVAWLRTVAIRMYFRQIPKHEILTDTPPDRPILLSPAVEVEITEQTEAMLELLAILPTRQRLVIALKADGLSTAEIADALGMTAEAIRQNLHRARRRLKDHLNTCQGGAR